jgi:hypothetical protein
VMRNSWQRQDGHSNLDHQQSTEGRRRHGRALSESAMHDERRAFESRRAKQHGLPEIAHPWQMRGPTHMGDVVKNRPENVIVSQGIICRMD